MNKYLNYDGTLKDNKILEDINKVGNIYRDGELLENSRYSFGDYTSNRNF